MTEEKAKARIASLQAEIEQIGARQQQLVAEHEQTRDAIAARRGAIAVLQEMLPTETPATVTPISEAAPPAHRAGRRRAAR